MERAMESFRVNHRPPYDHLHVADLALALIWTMLGPVKGLEGHRRIPQGPAARRISIAPASNAPLHRAGSGCMSPGHT
jgi:hypothetical protein